MDKIGGSVNVNLGKKSEKKKKKLQEHLGSSVGWTSRLLILPQVMISES